MLDHRSEPGPAAGVSVATPDTAGWNPSPWVSLLPEALGIPRGPHHLPSQLCPFSLTFLSWSRLLLTTDQKAGPYSDWIGPAQIIQSNLPKSRLLT